MTGQNRETRNEPNIYQLEANSDQPTRGARCESSALSSKQEIMGRMKQVIIQERCAIKNKTIATRKE